jgi:formylglycine-generating enzyme required for sulfatase activity
MRRLSRLVCLVGVLGAVGACDLAAVSLPRLGLAIEGEGSIRSLKPTGLRCPGDCEELVPPGTAVELSASPGEDARLVGWDGPCEDATAPICAFSMPSGPVEVVARFGPASHTLTVEIDATVSATVASTPPGLVCPGRCSARFPADAEVELEARVGPEATPPRWSGDCEGARCRVRLDGDRSVRLSAARRQWRLALAVESGQGSLIADGALDALRCPGSCTGTVAHGGAVRLRAEPDAGWRLAAWTGACADASAECRLVLTSSAAAGVRFERVRHRVRLRAAGDGRGRLVSSPAGLDCGAVCEAEFDALVPVTVTATPALGSRFQGWDGACSGDGACVLPLDAPAELTARFALEPVRLVVTATGSGAGTVVSTPAGIDCGSACDLVLPYGSVVGLVATASASSRFLGWGGDCGADPCSVVLDAERRVSARFELRRHRLSVGLDGPGTGRVRSDALGLDCGAVCAVDADHGTAFELVAEPAADAVFAGWSGACTGLGPCRGVLRGPVSVRARFEPRLHPVVVVLEGDGVGRVTGGGLDCGPSCLREAVAGTELELTASHGRGFRFAGWAGACTGLGTCALRVDGPRLVRARFEAVYVALPPAPFVMGTPPGRPGADADESPTGVVALTRHVWMRATEVTRAEWRRTMGSDPSRGPRCGDDCPVDSVSWEDAVRFALARSAEEGLEPCYQGGGPGAWELVAVDCNGYRLPTEAEFEWAARAGTTGDLPSGDLTAIGETCARDSGLSDAWYCANSQGAPSPVGVFRANAFGLSDLLGNVAEWTHDRYATDAYATRGDARDPTGPLAGAERVVRGGSYLDLPRDLRPASRRGLPRDARRADLGFRLVRTAWVRMEAGRDRQGSPPGEPGRSAIEGPVREVLRTRPLLVSPFEVTRGQWAAVTGTAPPGLDTCPSCPVAEVDWPAAVGFTRLLSFFSGRGDCYASSVFDPPVWFDLRCRGDRLPTEAEWEALARAGSAEALSSGPITRVDCDDPNAALVAWHCGNAGDMSHPVGGLRPNALGLYDVHGNVAEWVWDRYDPLAYASGPVRDPVGPDEGSERVVRGGGYTGGAGSLRFAARGASPVDLRASTLGLRTVRAACSLFPGSQRLASAEPPPRAGGVALSIGHGVALVGGTEAGAPAPIRLLLSAWGQVPDVATGAPAGSWSLPSATDHPGLRVDAAAAVLGTELFVWGGTLAGAARADGAVYRPSLARWTATATVGAPSARAGALAVATGVEVLVFGGQTAGGWASDGARYVPAARTWLPLSPGPLSPRASAAGLALADGSILVAGGEGPSGPLADAALYAPRTDTWTALPPAPGACAGATEARGTDSHAVIAGPSGVCALALDSQTWHELPARPDGRARPPAAAWASTGPELVVFGGPSVLDMSIDRYDPVGRAWTSDSQTASNFVSATGGPAAWDGCSLLLPPVGATPGLRVTP